MNKIIILGHENPDVDSIVSGYLLEKIMNKKGYDVEYIIPDESIQNETLNICNRYGLNPTRYIKKISSNKKSNKYILVDHSERKINGEIVCIIDHHPVEKEIKIKHYYNKKISSTACFIAQKNENLLNEFDLRLACLATLVDTASFHSTKSRTEDKEWVIKTCNNYKINYEELYNEGLCLTKMDNIYEIYLNGLKKHNINGKEIQSSYIQIIENDQNKLKIIFDLLKKYINKNNLYAFIFIVHDMLNFKTTYYYITKENIEIRKYNVYASRGSTIIPEVTKKLIKIYK